jgi:hypothetical protein
MIKQSILPRVLLWTTLVNYIAQIPYYLYNDYFPRHALPTASGVVLLGLTLGWFLAGYISYEQNKNYGYKLLISFLITESLFYFYTLVSGAFFFQLQNPSVIIKIIFIIGYINGAMAAYCAFRLYRTKKLKSP